MSDDDKPPYDYSNPNDRPGGAAPVPAPVVAAPAPTPAPVAVAPPGDPNAPYNYGNPNDRPGGQAPPTTPDASGDSPLWTALQKPTTSFSDLWDATKLTAQGVADSARVAGNQAVVPHLLDRTLAQMPWSPGYDAEAAKTAAAEKDLGSFSEIPKWVGQNYSAQGVTNRVAGGNPIVSAVANNPITTGLVTGGGGTIAGGDLDPMHILKNAATTALESKAGQAIGNVGAIAAGYVGNTGKALYQKAQDEATAALNASDIPGWTAAMQKAASVRALEALKSLYTEGGDVIGQARNLANQTTGAASDAYNKIADSAGKDTAQRWAGNAATGAMTWLTGGPAAATVATGANELANKLHKYTDVTSSIDQAFPNVTGYVKSAVDPQNWRNAASSAAVSAGADYNALRDKVANFSPTGFLHNVPGASYLGY